MKNITLYCDGGCRGNGKEKTLGAWAYVILDENNNIVEELSNVDENCSTNIRAEMFALSEGLKAIAMLSEIDEISDINIKIYTDSKFICNCFNLNWIDS
jgi:ribonuclease HI